MNHFDTAKSAFRDSVLEEAARAVEPSWGPAAASKVRSLKGMATKANNALYEAAVDAEYPIPDSPHASVMERAAANREAFRRGWFAIKGKASSEAAAPDLPGLKEAIVAALNNWETEMEGYAYFGSNPGVKRDDYEDIADEVVEAISKSPTSLAGSGEKGEGA